MSTAKNRKFHGLTVFLLGLSSCTYVTAPPKQPAVELPKAPVSTPSTALQAQSSLASRLRTRQAMAEDLMRRADLAAALIQWKILHALDPGNVEFSRQLNTTQTLIQQRVNIHMQLGEQAYTQGDFKQATLEFLRVLALDPHQSRPRTYLRQIEQRHLKNMLRMKLAGSTRAKEKAVLSPDQGPPR